MLKFLSLVQDKGLFHNGVKNPRITTINLASNINLDDKSLMNIAVMCLNMEILDVSLCTDHTEAGIISTLEVCNQIRYLQLDKGPGIKHIGEGAVGSILNDEGLAMIGNIFSLQLK
ncbi:hypothetical protein H5410_001471 [Solanum commersonii]|uniref:RNI-like protein n=1 Tax=Solanum commersonii TaxID=4109 RepID=A0A9J6AZP7_SOLCO|nr:hypothetical protein H5410_001471 [Solanum commersonii]